MSKEKIKEVEQNLKCMRHRLNESFILLTQEKNRTDKPLTQNLDDQSMSLENDQVIDELDRLDRIELLKIDNALTRIKNGTYGKCRICSEEIKPKRLSALPYATTCIECANELN